VIFSNKFVVGLPEYIQEKTDMFSIHELELIRKALNSHKIDCCKAIDSVKKTVGKNDPVYESFAGQYYQEINLADVLIDRIKGAMP